MNDWPWPVKLLLLLAAATGHLCHFIAAINVVSSLGYPERVLDRLRFWLFAAPLGFLRYLALDALAQPILELAVARFSVTPSFA